MQIQEQSVKTAGDVAATGIAFGSFLQFLPSIAAALSIIWMVGRFIIWAYNWWKSRK